MHIEMNAVTKQYEKTVALNSVSLTFGAGGIVSVLGKNGAGKTTLLRILCGVAGLTRGSLRFDNEPFSRDRIDQRKRFFVIPDTPAVFAGLTPIQYAGVVFKLYGRADDDLADRLTACYADLEILPQANKPLGSLSRGQLYKAVLATLAVLRPELWLLDEPFASGMDPAGLYHFKRYVREARDAGCTILYSTQILEVNRDFADRIILLDQGSVKHDAPPMPEDDAVLLRLLGGPVADGAAS